MGGTHTSLKNRYDFTVPLALLSNGRACVPAYKMNQREWLKEFICLYRNEPCLWQLKSKAYHDREMKKLAYSKLINKLKQIDKNADKDAVIKKINNIRSTFRKEHKKVINSKMCAGDTKIYSPRLWYYQLLLFLEDQENATPSCSNMDDDLTENEELMDEPQPLSEVDVASEELTDTETLPARESTSMRTSSVLPASDSTSTRTSNVLPASDSTVIQPRKRRIDKSNDNLNDEVLETVTVKRPVRNNDRFDIFGANVAAKLRDLTKQQRILAEKLISETLFEAEMGNLNVSYRVMDTARTIHTRTPSPFGPQHRLKEEGDKNVG